MTMLIINSRNQFRRLKWVKTMKTTSTQAKIWTVLLTSKASYLRASAYFRSNSPSIQFAWSDRVLSSLHLVHRLAWFIRIRYSPWRCCCTQRCLLLLAFPGRFTCISFSRFFFVLHVIILPIFHIEASHWPTYQNNAWNPSSITTNLPATCKTDALIFLSGTQTLETAYTIAPSPTKHGSVARISTWSYRIHNTFDTFWGD